MAKPPVLLYQVLTMLLICTEHGPSEEDHVIGAAHGTITTSHIYDTITATGQQHLPVLQPSPSYGSSSSTALQALPIKEHSTRGYDSGLGTCIQERMAKPPVLLYQVLTMLLICTEHGPSEEDHVIGAAHGTITTSHIYDTITATGQQHLPVLQPSPSYGSSSSTALQALPIKEHSTRGYDSGLGTCIQERMAKPPVLLYQVLTMLLICTEHGPSEEDHVIGAAHGTITTSHIYDTITATGQQHLPVLQPSPSYGSSSSTALQALPIKEHSTRGYDSGLGTCIQERMAKPPVLLYQVLTMLLICTEHGPSEEDHVIGAAHGTITTSHIYDTITATGQQHLPVLQPSPSYGSSSSTALQALPIKEHSTRGYDSGLGTCIQERMAKPPVLLYQRAVEEGSSTVDSQLGRIRIK
ncbi:uncharacterized protein ISCGN_013408 [Ixodes scapularis]